MESKVRHLKLTNVLSVTVTIKSDQKRNSRNDKEEGVTPQINKCKECDSDHVKLALPRHGK